MTPSNAACDDGETHVASACGQHKFMLRAQKSQENKAIHEVHCKRRPSRAHRPHTMPRGRRASGADAARKRAESGSEQDTAQQGASRRAHEANDNPREIDVCEAAGP
eukprot:6847724-Alexandrium_andersonii.AAC.2